MNQRIALAFGSGALAGSLAGTALMRLLILSGLCCRKPVRGTGVNAIFFFFLVCPSFRNLGKQVAFQSVTEVSVFEWNVAAGPTLLLTRGNEQKSAYYGISCGHAPTARHL